MWRFSEFIFRPLLHLMFFSWKWMNTPLKNNNLWIPVLLWILTELFSKELGEWYNCILWFWITVNFCKAQGKSVLPFFKYFPPSEVLYLYESWFELHDILMIWHFEAKIKSNEKKFCEIKIDDEVLFSSRRGTSFRSAQWTNNVQILYIYS